jgi:hypothetical protein
MMWQSMISRFIELAPYSTIVEALEQTARRLNLSFPDLNDAHNRAGDGRFSFGVSDGLRTIQIWPMESRGCYDVELLDYTQSPDGHCYKGQTTSLKQVTVALSRWFVERCSIESLHVQLPWMSREPLQLSGSRMTLE